MNLYKRLFLLMQSFNILGCWMMMVPNWKQQKTLNRLSQIDWSLYIISKHCNLKVGLILNHYINIYIIKYCFWGIGGGYGVRCGIILDWSQFLLSYQPWRKGCSCTLIHNYPVCLSRSCILLSTDSAFRAAFLVFNNCWFVVLEGGTLPNWDSLFTKKLGNTE